MTHGEFRRKMGYRQFCQFDIICDWSCWNIKENDKKIRDDTFDHKFKNIPLMS